MLSSLMCSLCHRVQKSRLTFDMYCQEESLFAGMLLKSCSGNSVSGLPIKKWPGVSAWRSLGFVDMVVMSRDFRMDSTCIMKVFSSS